PASSPLFLLPAPATTEIYTLSLHDALPIWDLRRDPPCPRHQRVAGQFEAQFGQQRREAEPVACATRRPLGQSGVGAAREQHGGLDRKSTRLNSSHVKISYAVFCLKKKKTTT